jgi:RNA polymerase sigma-70 factor (ECF subfamily)
MTPSAHDDPLQQAMDDELLQALRRALAELPWYQRAAWLLREVEAMSYDEIATALALKALAMRMATWR